MLLTLRHLERLRLTHRWIELLRLLLVIRVEEWRCIGGRMLRLLGSELLALWLLLMRLLLQTSRQVRGGLEWSGGREWLNTARLELLDYGKTCRKWILLDTFYDLRQVGRHRLGSTSSNSSGVAFDCCGVGGCWSRRLSGGWRCEGHRRLLDWHHVGIAWSSSDWISRRLASSSRAADLEWICGRVHGSGRRRLSCWLEGTPTNVHLSCCRR